MTESGVWTSRELSRLEHQNAQARKNGYRPPTQHPFVDYVPPLAKPEVKRDDMQPTFQINIDPVEVVEKTLGRHRA